MPELVRPDSVEDLAAALRSADAAGHSVGISGAGTKAGWGGPGEPVDVVIDTTALSGVVEHAAADLVATVRAGTPLADLQQALAAHGQWLALDPPERGATIGGVVATAASGPRRLRWGTPRDLLIGVTVVLADGTVARSGGKVVKNVAGYDLGKLLTGSFGTLGVVAECTFRLHPDAESRRVVSVSLDDPGPAVGLLLRAPVQPTAIEYDGAVLHVLVESLETSVAAHADAVAALTGGSVAPAPPATFGLRPWGPGDLGLKVTFRIGALSQALAAVRRVLPGGRIAAHAGSGVLWSGSRTGDAPAVLDELRRELAAYDGGVVVVEAPADVKAGVDVWGPVRGLEVMRRIKAEFDPHRRLNPGRFVGGI